MSVPILIVLFVAVLSLILCVVILRKDAHKLEDLSPAQKISTSSLESAQIILGHQFGKLALIGAVVFIAMFVFDVLIAIGLVIGMLCAILIGYGSLSLLGRNEITLVLSTENGRRTDKSLMGGIAAGLLISGLGLLSIAVYYLLLEYMTPSKQEVSLAPLLGLGMGASLTAIFVRYSSTVLGYLPGQQGSQTDPASGQVSTGNLIAQIAKNAGIPVNLYENFVLALIATIIVGSLLLDGHPHAVLYPLVLAAVCLPMNILSVYFMQLGEGRSITHAIEKGVLSAFLFNALAGYVITEWLMADVGSMNSITLFSTIAMGTLLAIILASIARISNVENSPVRLNITETILLLLAIILVINLASKLSGLYGVALLASTFLNVTCLMMVLGALDHYQIPNDELKHGLAKNGPLHFFRQVIIVGRRTHYLHSMLLTSLVCAALAMIVALNLIDIKNQTLATIVGQGFFSIGVLLGVFSIGFSSYLTTGYFNKLLTVIYQARPQTIEADNNIDISEDRIELGAIANKLFWFMGLPALCVMCFFTLVWVYTDMVGVIGTIIGMLLIGLPLTIYRTLTDFGNTDEVLITMLFPMIKLCSITAVIVSSFG